MVLKIVSYQILFLRMLELEAKSFEVYILKPYHSILYYYAILAHMNSILLYTTRPINLPTYR